MLWWLLSIAGASECAPELAGPANLDDAISRADAAIGALDVPALEAATAHISTVLACQTGPLSITRAAQVHRVRGIDAFVHGDEATADLWFAASRALEPTHSLGHDIGGPLTSAWNRAVSTTPPARTPLPPPRRGVLFVDGQALATYPSHLPWVFQHQDGADLTTALQLPGDPLPPYPGRPKPQVEQSRRGRPFTAAAIATGALSVSALAGAAWTRERYKRTDLTNDQVAGLVPMNRALGATGWSLVGITAGLGTIAVVRGEW